MKKSDCVFFIIKLDGVSCLGCVALRCVALRLAYQCNAYLRGKVAPHVVVIVMASQLVDPNGFLFLFVF